jgi:hypothetical protein
LKDGSLGNYLHRAANVGDSGLRDRIGCRRAAAAFDNPGPAAAKPDLVCRSIEPDWGIAGFRDASPTMPGGLRAGSARSPIGGATFAGVQCHFTVCSPPPSRTRLLVSGRRTYRRLDRRIDLTRIGLGSRATSIVTAVLTTATLSGGADRAGSNDERRDVISLFSGLPRR